MVTQQKKRPRFEMLTGVVDKDVQRKASLPEEIDEAAYTVDTG